MERQEMIERICERVQEADQETLEELFWFLELEREG